MQSDQATPEKYETRSQQSLHAAQIPDALLRIETAAQISGLSAPTLYRRAKDDPTFPRLIKMGRRCTRIRAGDFTAWLVSKAEAA